MRFKSLVLVTLLFGVAVGTGRKVHASQCTASVENIDAEIGEDGALKKFYTQWRVGHDVGDRSFATVQFSYDIHYRTTVGMKRSVRGVFAKTVRGRKQPYTVEDVAPGRPLDPASIISVDFDDITCRE